MMHVITTIIEVLCYCISGFAGGIITHLGAEENNRPPQIVGISIIVLVIIQLILKML